MQQSVVILIVYRSKMNVIARRPTLQDTFAKAPPPRAQGDLAERHILETAVARIPDTFCTSGNNQHSQYTASGTADTQVHACSVRELTYLRAQGDLWSSARRYASVSSPDQYNFGFNCLQSIIQTSSSATQTLYLMRVRSAPLGIRGSA
jgi:hypothetical protein